MKFADPKTDFGFKRIFANQAHADVLISFLNTFLALPKDKEIVSVHIADPYNNRLIRDAKLSIVDVRCTTKDHGEFIVEVQRNDEKNYAQRSQYYVAQAMARQLKDTDGYEKIVPVNLISVLDFNFLQDSTDYLSTHLILDQKTHRQHLAHMSFTYIELKKFHKTQDQVKTVIDQWIYVLKNATELETIPSILQATPAINQAMQLLNQGNMTSQELADYQDEINLRRIEKDVLETALQKAEAKGEAKGKAEGIAEGERNAKLELARSMLAEKMSLEVVAKLTGLAVDELVKL
jgi:predicted transposase/invertase (TIGR01784 family)